LLLEFVFFLTKTATIAILIEFKSRPVVGFKLNLRTALFKRIDNFVYNNILHAYV